MVTPFALSGLSVIVERQALAWQWFTGSVTEDLLAQQLCQTP